MKDKVRTLAIKRARDAKKMRNAYFGNLLFAEALYQRATRGRQMIQTFP